MKNYVKIKLIRLRLTEYDKEKLEQNYFDLINNEYTYIPFTWNIGYTDDVPYLDYIIEKDEPSNQVACKLLDKSRPLTVNERSKYEVKFKSFISEFDVQNLEVAEYRWYFNENAIWEDSKDDSFYEEV